MNEALRVGLVGAGAWARAVHAPMLAAGPETVLTGIWSRTAARADEVAARHGAPTFQSFDALLETCDAVALAVPPAVQPALAEQAIAAGRPVLLEKPLALDVAGAERIADAASRAGVGSLVALTYRFAPSVRTFLTDAEGFAAMGGRGCFLSGAYLGGPYVGGWRNDAGALLDVGPHIVDLLDAALGPVVAIEAAGDPHEWVSLVLTHEGGQVSDVSISCRAAITPSRTEVELFGPDGSLTVDGRADDRTALFANLRTDFARVARTGEPHECDAQRGLYLQRLLARATACLEEQGPEIRGLVPRKRESEGD